MPDPLVVSKRSPARLLLAVAVLGVLGACGDDDDTASDTTVAAAPATSPTTGPASSAAPTETSAAGTETSAAGTGGTDAGAEVTIVDFTFEPSPVTVAAGQPLVFTNDDGTTHSVASSTSDLLVSDPLAPGDSFTVTFDTPGTYDYFCGIHGEMTGTVEVTA